MTQLTLLSVVAMEDCLRPDVVEAVRLAKKGNIKVILVSGDYKETAVSFALAAKIVKKHEVSNKKICMDAKYFRENGGSFIEGT